MFTCISCRVAFEDAGEQRTHFSTDWHRYNMKRRVANLPPVAATAFNEKVIERREQNAVRTDPRDMACAACKKTFSTENAYRSHVQSKKHREREIMHARALQQGQEVGAEDDSDDDEGDEEEEARDGAQEEDMDQEMGTSSSIRPTSPGSEHTDSDEEGDIETRLASARRRRHQPSDCLFCSTKSSSIETCLKHMSSVHSFFLPDSDHLVDLPGLLAYLGEKVIVGNICLYCPGGNKEFGSLEAVRRHMIDKSHCKVAFEDDDDRAELSDYYDFAIGGAGDEWEDVEDDGDHDMDAPFRNTMPSLANDGLSLMLPSGRVLGHRALRVYYAQNLRPARTDTGSTVSKLALVKQQLADPTQALIHVAGGTGDHGRGLQMMKARNAGEAKWAKAQARNHKDQRVKEQHKTKVAYKHNSQKHFRDPLLQ